jgi:hypothetical protein
MKTPEELIEYEEMYNEVMKNVETPINDVSELVELLIEKCYYISLHNDLLQEQINRAMRILRQESTDTYTEDDLPS